MSKGIITHVEDRVLIITFDRLDRRNAINSAMYAAIADALTDAADDPKIRVALLQGHEKIFTAGNDISEFRDADPSSESPAFRFLRVIAEFPKALVAAVSGPAVGIGTTMLLHCDLVYASETAAFSLPFVDLGLCTEAASSLLLPQLLGHHRAAQALLLGEPVQASDALNAGLVNGVLPTAEVNAFAKAQARKLATKPSCSVREIKRLMKAGQREAVERQMAEEMTIFRRMLAAPAAKEAFTAFLEKRSPDFSNT